MPQYVETDYSNDYAEGDTTSEAVTNCDLTAVNAELALIKQQNIDLNTKLDVLLSAIQSNNTLNLSINTKLVDLDTKTDSLATQTDVANIPQTDISNLVTKQYIDDSVPFVDDMSVKVFPNGTTVSVTGYDGQGTVISSQLLPYEDFTYTVTYTVSFDVDGVANVSNFLAQQVVKILAEA